MEQHVTQGDALAAVANAGGSGAAKLLGDLFEANARHSDWVDKQIKTGLERERDEWKARAIYAENRLRRIESRLFDLLD